MNADSWICWPSNYWAPESSSPAPVAVRMSNPGAAPEYASVKVGVSLESDSHDAPAGASQSIQHSSASTARVAIQRCAVLPRGRRLSLSGSPGKTPVRHAPVRASMPGKNRPYSRPTSPRETDTRASQERLASPRLGLRPPEKVFLKYFHFKMFWAILSHAGLSSPPCPSAQTAPG